MIKFPKTICLLLLAGLLGCDREDIKLFLGTINPNTFYSEEIIPDNYQKIYGKWSLHSIDGGFSGTGHEPNHDFLEIKSIGIYGVVRNDSLLEYGKISLDTFDTRTTEFLQIRLLPESSDELFFISPPEKYVHLNGSDEMVLQSPCCDWYNYSYKRADK